MSALQTVQHALERNRGRAASSRNPYTRTVGAAAAVLTLAGLGIGLYFYARWTPDSQPGQGGDEWAAGGGGAGSRRSGADGVAPKGKESTTGPQQPPATSQSRRRLPRPSLSLSLPPTFDRTSPQALQLLHDLIAALAEHFLIHLILPDSSSSNPSSSSSDDASSSAGGTGALAAVFADVLDFDTRRLLLYGTPAGRQALSVALACDAHVEISFVGEAEQQHEGAEDSIKKVEHLQRTAGVVVLCVLPAPGRQPSSATSRSSLDAVLEHFKKASFSRSVRIIDACSPSAEGGAQDHQAQWESGAARIVELRAKMK
ncbi:hypothetical protein A4X13_0g676 [Tilletia indica]|uniref:Uncharacterized protein n=1 Tax=Tilletia indica TaxID=43049 RepID=A0A177TV25_9BASI|nr:hypothetical protein A4X13_0g676 [Tilletia indica]